MRLIDADALLKSAGIFEATMGARGCGKSILHLAKAWLFNEINKAQTIDAVEVVRCGLCRYCDTKDCPMSGTPGSVSVSDFCSYGERKEYDKD